MKQGKDIVELAQEIKRRAENKADYLVGSKFISMTNTGMIDFSTEALVMPGTDLAHRQIGTYLDIPTKYYNRMLAEAPHLLAKNVNHWFGNSGDGERRMVRTLDTKVRAFLSDRYRRLDNEDVAEAALPTLLSSPEINLVSADITETRLYLKAVFPRVEGEVKRGDVVQAGVVISNSEVGLGALSVEPMVYRLACLNGMIFTDNSFKKMHIGSRLNTDDYSARIFREATLEADDRALLMVLQDTIAAASKQTFEMLLDRMRDAAGSEKVERPRPAVERLGKSFGLLSHEQDSILEQLIRGQDYSKWGMANAVTALANVTDDYDRGTELQALGSKIIALPRTDWRVLAEAA